MSNMKDGGPAFPQDPNWSSMRGGMTLRDYFAAAALTGFLANPTGHRIDRTRSTSETLAEAAYLMADAMLAERAKDRP